MFIRFIFVFLIFLAQATVHADQAVGVLLCLNSGGIALLPHSMTPAPACADTHHEPLVKAAQSDCVDIHFSPTSQLAASRRQVSEAAAPAPLMLWPVACLPDLAQFSSPRQASRFHAGISLSTSDMLSLRTVVLMV